ncbi:hypothetical protein EUGRSUZ_K00158 [Eucalyptus grandis]|uniref:Uncharacterized protein n=2 Tax=Eucalyptus grandis TaxID=71139 RepID=A0ACC3IPK2_EUCGR|nr:hypothetical protein EUGRSUZ_K00158 [Eucalyptus grandis]
MGVCKAHTSAGSLMGSLVASAMLSCGWDSRVAPFAFCLFFSKLVAYTFLYWLPYYISHTAIGGKCLSGETAGDLSTLFDVGGLPYFAIPALFLYRCYGYVSLPVNITLMFFFFFVGKITLMFITGIFVNGPYALITTAVSTDLGTHGSLKGNSRALATVTAIIDGTGSIGAAIGPFLTGYISAESWGAVF